MTHDQPALNPETIPWVPLRQGLSMRPLRFERSGYSLQLRLEPGTRIGPHRHTGPVHALNLSGARRLIEADEIVEPGDFVYEPAGNTDSWECFGDAPCVVQITLRGRVEYLDDAGAVIDHSDSQTAEVAYRAHCASLGIAPDERIIGSQ
ncbi:MAG TPA: cupin domain-containing protein [Brevundimonas sp.]|jgi:2,4'-dihydroxyacetophenone dioxygenase|uniref:cupin domain-containing protein n=1 Tax=Brevundimonas sp. TaxID=1871086 RepID=UPI002C807319|nr:cupin domain-containing protein [Brevundimonas sp.]HRH20838.1 cupin domain-containing protein [Brevundimonas sp.]